ncbi:hypothetical protein ASZ90_019260 [hydrocarbon metagenome]|uniref:Uncharacterized protein n=1 Tax=hydrocarbon metagenome TaxID=938273 RepID=A0A0W8E3Y6_9ZZZZ
MGKNGKICAFCFRVEQDKIALSKFGICLISPAASDSFSDQETCCRCLMV